MNYLAVTSVYLGLRLFTLDGDLVYIVPKSSSVTCAALHPHNANILAIGFRDGTVRMRCAYISAPVLVPEAHQARFQHSNRN